MNSKGSAIWKKSGGGDGMWWERQDWDLPARIGCQKLTVFAPWAQNGGLWVDIGWDGEEMRFAGWTSVSQHTRAHVRTKTPTHTYAPTPTHAYPHACSLPFACLATKQDLVGSCSMVSFSMLGVLATSVRLSGPVSVSAGRMGLHD